MAFRVVRLGSARQLEEGLRIGTVRRPPRAVRKQDYAVRDYFDVLLPELAPSATCLLGAVATVHARALGQLRAPVQTGNVPTAG